MCVEKRVEINAVAAGSHMETKRGIDYMQIDIIKKHLIIDGAVVDTMLSTPSNIDLNLTQPRLRQGTNCTAQPTVDDISQTEHGKGLRQ